MSETRSLSVLSVLMALGVAIATPMFTIQAALAQTPDPTAPAPATPTPTPAAPTPTPSPAPTPAPVPPPATPSASPSPRADLPLVERTTYVNTCRNSGGTALPVYTSSTLSQTLRTLQPYTRVVLTGVLGQGIAQINSPVTGWVRSATLLSNCDAGPVNPEPVRGACYQVTQPQLTVRTAPYGSAITTVALNQRVYATNPPNRNTSSDGRRWLQVYYNQSTSLGWVAETGTGGLGLNITPCP